MVSSVDLDMLLAADSPGDGFGFATSSSEDGKIIAVSAYKNDNNGDRSGHVKIFELVEGQYVQKGSEIPGENPKDQASWSVSLSADGSSLAMTARGYDTNEINEAGQVRVFKWEDNAWIQRGQSISGEETKDAMGNSVSLSNNGDTMAVGSSRHDGNKGQVRVFQFDYSSKQWVQAGAAIDGISANDYFGGSLQLSGDGKILVAGAGQYDALPEQNIGHARVFKYLNSQWLQMGDALEGIYSGDFSAPAPQYQRMEKH